MPGYLIDRLNARAHEAGLPKSELYKEAAEHIELLENTMSRIRTKLLIMDATTRLSEKEIFLDQAIELTSNPKFLINIDGDMDL